MPNDLLVSHTLPILFDIYLLYIGDKSNHL